MRVIEDVRNCAEEFGDVVLTIGSFDGFHLGHQKIFSDVLEEARAIGGVPAVMTLEPHPRQYFSPDNAPNILTPLVQKQRLLAEAGAEVFFVLPFNGEVAQMSPRDFLEEIVLGRCGARALIVGHDFAFGRGASGNYAWLEEAAPPLGLAVRETPPLIVQGERVSSTLIRERVLQGDMEGAASFLGRKYAIPGEVVRGRGIGGAKLGYPTANVKPLNSAAPAHGVYAGEVRLGNQSHVSAINIGIAPTIRHEDVTIEAFILDFSGDIVGESIEVVFHKRLRPEKKFTSHDALIAAIDADVAAVRAHFGIAPG